MHFYLFALTAHSWIRWIFLLLLIISIFIACRNWIKHSKRITFQKKISTITVSFAHLQLLIGFILYFISPKVKFEAISSPIIRFYSLEHIGLMIIAIIILTIGSIKAKKVKNDIQSSKIITVWFIIALFIILIAIPWPFRNLGATWF